MVDGLSFGAGQFDYDDIRSGHRIPVFYYCPPKISRSTQVLLVMHGVLRNANKYRDVWIHLVQQHDVILVAPEFSEEHFPGCQGYNLGNICEGNAASLTENSAIAILERLFDHIRQTMNLTTEEYLLYGHSAGAQFVHRAMLFLDSPRVRIAVAANAGWYTLPTFETQFPYGLGNSPCSTEQLRLGLEKRLVLLLGEQDTERADKHLRMTQRALQQGEHRYERGQTAFRIARETATAMKTRFGWGLESVPKIGHSNLSIAPIAAAILLAEATRL